MAHYVVEHHSLEDGSFTTEGRVVDVLGYRTANTPRVTVLVEKGRRHIFESVSTDSEGMTLDEISTSIGVEASEHPTDEKATCAGKDGDCSRTVEKEGDYCWQHHPDG